MNNNLRLLKNAALIGAAIYVIRGIDMRLETVRYTVSSKKIPKEFNGFRIVQLSDYHNDTVPGLLENVSAEVPDLICTTGDMADDKGSFDPAVNLFRCLSDIAPTLAISGNHEMWRSDYRNFIKAIRKAGAIFLDDEVYIAEQNGARLPIYGVNDPFSRDNARMTMRVDSAIERLGIDNSLFNILLFHRANMFDSIKTKGFDLILSGHMHGGQFRLPTGQGLVAPKSSFGSNSKVLFPKYFGGRYEYMDTVMIVNRGLGNPMVIPRLFNRPELTVITLKSE